MIVSVVPEFGGMPRLVQITHYFVVQHKDRIQR